MKTPCKILTFALAASMIMPLAACSKKKTDEGTAKSRSGQKISEDSTWFDAEQIVLKLTPENDRDIDYIFHEFAGSDEKYMAVFSNGYYLMPDNIDWNNWNYNDYAIDILTLIDIKTNEAVHTIDLTGILTPNDYIETASYSDGIATVVCSGYDSYANQPTKKEVDIDVANGCITARREYQGSQDGYVERTCKIGGFRVNNEVHWGEKTYFTLHIFTPDGAVNSVDIKDQDMSVYDIPFLAPVSDTSVLVPANTEKGYLYYEMDLNTGALTQKDSKEYDWMDIENIYAPFIGSDGNAYYMCNTGIMMIDIQKKTTKEMFNYSWCGLSRNKVSYLSIADISEDSIIMCGSNYEISAYKELNPNEFMLIRFSRAESNPHAGKTVLELYSSYGYVDEKISDAIMKFNMTNGEYFIEVSDRYSDILESADYSDVNSDDEYDSIRLHADFEMSSHLAMDIISGNGPDILMDVSSYGQLNNTNYLADLSPYIGELDPEKYFTNIIEAARFDGNLYNLPVCFQIHGIQTDPQYAGQSGIGFTTEEYEAFLNGTLNGQDIISSGQTYYFAKLFTNMSEKFIINGKADFSVPEFEKLALFVKNNVPVSSREWSDYTDNRVYETSYAVGAAIFKGDGNTDDIAFYGSYCGISSYLYHIGNLRCGTAVLGMPSTDGRGPSVDPYVSVAVSAQSCSIDACGEFVKMLLSEDVQKEFAMNDNLVLDREAYREAGMAAVDYYNNEGRDLLYTGYVNPSNRYEFSGKNVDDFEAIILSCSKMTSEDAAISIILVEEMPAFFLGQKTLQEVVRIAQDRAQKALDERA